MAENSLKGFVGAAGTGKTFNLVKEAEAVAKAVEWESYQVLLGLTFMHGSRKRLDDRLAHLKKEGVPVQCKTIDSFCLDIVRRFRVHLGYDRQLEIDTNITNCEHCECHQWSWVLSIEKLRSEMVRALQREDVKKSIAASHPVIIVDEFQDCDGSLFEIIKILSEKSLLLVAADPFQRLEIEEGTCDGTVCDSVEWVKESGEAIPLENCQRTNKPRLLNTAEALRLGIPKSNCILVRNFDGPGLAAFYISRALAEWTDWRWSNEKDVVIITPLNEEKSKFVSGILKSLQKKLGQGKKYGPFPFYWEQSEQEQVQEVYELLPKTDPESGIICKDELRKFQCSENKLVTEVCKKGLRVSSLRGLEGISKSDLTDIVRKRIHSKMAFSTATIKRKRLIMTVHGAKNREFSNVFILWPHAIKNDLLHRRKLLYNAVTRATKQAMLLVEGPEKRLNSDEILSLIVNKKEV